MKILLLTFYLIFFISCSSQSNDFDYSKQNDRFNYNNAFDFKESLLFYFDSLSMNYDENIIIINENKNFNKDIISKIVRENKHENFIANNPEEILNVIKYIYNSSNDEKKVFESIQTYLRYLFVKPLDN